MYGALIDHLPIDLCHEIVSNSCEFTATPEEAKRYVTEFMRDFDGDIVRVHSYTSDNDEGIIVTYDPLSRGISDHTLVCDTDYNIGTQLTSDFTELIISGVWDIGTSGDGYGELTSTRRIVEKQSRHRREWMTILSAKVTDGTVARNWEEHGNMYLEPTEWFVKIGS